MSKYEIKIYDGEGNLKKIIPSKTEEEILGSPPKGAVFEINREKKRNRYKTVWTKEMIRDLSMPGMTHQMFALKHCVSKSAVGLKKRELGLSLEFQKRNCQICGVEFIPRNNFAMMCESHYCKAEYKRLYKQKI